MKNLSPLCILLNPVANPFHTSSGVLPEASGSIQENPSMFSSMISGVTNTLNLKKNADPRADPKIAMREVQKRNVELEAYIKKIELNNDELLLMTTSQQRGIVPALAQKEKAKVQRSTAPMVKQNLALGKVLQPGMVEMNMRLHMDFRSVGQEGSTQRQMFIRDLRQDLADASGMYTADFNILKISPGSVVVDVNAPETAAQEIHRQSLDLNSRLRCGKLTRVIDTITLPIPELPFPQKCQQWISLARDAPVTQRPALDVLGRGRNGRICSGNGTVGPVPLNREALPNTADSARSRGEGKWGLSALTLLAADGFAGMLSAGPAAGTAVRAISKDKSPGLHRQQDPTPTRISPHRGASPTSRERTGKNAQADAAPRKESPEKLVGSQAASAGTAVMSNGTDTTKKEMRGLVHF
jgi:hypothetical protein